MNSASLGDKALANSDFPSAIQYFTQALIELPRAPPYYIKRSTAFSRLKPADGGPNYSAALHDAEIAVTLARERGKRELILAAQMRRGVALYQLERYGDAAFVFGTIQEKTAAGNEDEDKSEKVKNAMAGSAKNGYQELPIWTLKVKGKLNKLAEGDDNAAVTVAEYPTGIQSPSEKELKKQLEAFKSGKAGATGVQEPEKHQSSTDTGASSSTQGSESKPVAPSAAAAPSVDKVRHEWYQSNECVVVTLYVKGVPKDKASVQFTSDSAAIGFPLPSGADYDFTLDPLFAPIDPSASKVSVMSTKIELSLRKQLAGQKWNALEAVSTDFKLADRQAAVSSAPSSSAAPTYPSSSRQGPKDWDKVASTLTEKKTKAGDKGKKKATGDGTADPKNDKEGNESDGADSDYEGGDPVDSFFKKLYAGADPDTRRAMIKSYVESQGTSLSTNWNEVGQGKVEARPPSD
ncbi:SGT1 and CS domain protein [Aspergillus steynii IBT 23096]|uniref:SGT1 and CS domain protein n=1 Tax=Aspergillus steynii IBT 23096 TaxID=1392250 RepID=A0A2I2FR66_9EURO|nr:SGT1 and CS domain protein [Aspergillus steynii IBT 23096]PLB43128.1 SGT1 and CS domain protein [Aspergillus steynii IBT 23096]